MVSLYELVNDYKDGKLLLENFRDSIGDNFIQDDYNNLIDDMEEIPNEILKLLLITKKKIYNYKEEKIIGIDLYQILEDYDVSNNFFDDEEILETLDLDRYYYDSFLYNNYKNRVYMMSMWDVFFYNYEYDDDFIYRNIDRVMNCYTLQRYNDVPKNFFELCIEKDDFKYVNLVDQDISIDFYLKYAPIYRDKINFVRATRNVKDKLTIDIFENLLKHPNLSSEEDQNMLWYCVGLFNLDSNFISNNLDRINKLVHFDRITKIYQYGSTEHINVKMNSWYSICYNYNHNIDDKLIIDNIEYIDMDNKKIFKSYETNLLFLKDVSTNLLKYLILYFIDTNKKINYYSFLNNQRNTENLDDEIELLLEKNKLKLKKIDRLKYLSKNIIEKIS